MFKKIKLIIGKYKKKIQKKKVIQAIDKMYDELESDLLCIEIGSDIIPFIDAVLEKINSFRNETKKNKGFIFPTIRVIDNSHLQENEYLIKIYDKVVVQEFVIPTKEKINENLKSSFNFLFENFIEEIFTCEIMNKYINQVKNRNIYLIWNLTNVYSIFELKMIFLHLLKNKKSISNISYIMEKIGEMTFSEGESYYNDPIKVAKKLVKIL